MLTQARLREVLGYDPATGIFTWRVNTGRKKLVGAQAGCRTHGYVRIHIDGRRYYAHRLAWFYVHGRWPSKFIDHRHGSRHGDHLGNLREATPSQNQANRPIQSNNSSGAKGVTFAHDHKKWMASIMVDRRRRFLGYFDTVEEAAAAYKAAAETAFGEYARAG